MRFLGPVTQLGGARCGPTTSTSALASSTAGGRRATITRLLRVGFEVRLTAPTVDRQDVAVVMTRTHARALGLAEGARVWLTPTPGAKVVRRMELVG